MINVNAISSSKIIKTNIDPEIHKTEDALKLKESCQQFESILWTKLWKDMKQSAMAISGADKERPYKQMEDLSLEMATDDLIESSGGAGLWKMLYDSMIGKLAADKEAKEIREANEEAKSYESQPSSLGLDVRG